MNIFVLDKNPYKSASLMSNKHISKMVVESAQMMSTAHRFLDGHCELTHVKRKSHERSIKSHWKLDDKREDILYKATHIHHPCTVWVRSSVANYNWLFEHFVALNIEFVGRFGKVHATYTKLFDSLINPPKNIQQFSQTPFVQCFDDVYKDEDPIKGYKNYYRAKKLFTPTDFARFTLFSDET